MKLFFQALLLLVGIATAAARCTRRDKNSFVPVTYNATVPSLSNRVVSERNGLPGVYPRNAPGSFLPEFHSDRTIWRFAKDGVTMEQGYLRKNPGGALSGWLLVFGGKPGPQDIVTADIGCNEKGRHFLVMGGSERWRLCDIGRGGYSLNWGLTNGRKDCRKEVRWLWVDYVEPL
ncbi:hypothetical protein EDC01DRAFT_181040 [Geopyxis carbonaria]|nr:hypothetical protein EDC01DRAFT_181040 [Geopyxis carbonaria]